MVQPSSDISRWSWLKTLLAGAVLFILLEQALRNTGDILYVPSLLFVGAFTVPLSFCLFLYSRAKTPDVPWATLGYCVLWGGTLGTILAGTLEYKTLIELNAIPTLAIGIIEELAKIVIPLYILFRRPYKSVFDGIIIGVAVGAGFAALESMGYGLIALLGSGGDINATVQTLFFRGLMSPAAHIAWTGLLGGALWQARYSVRPHKIRKLFNTFLGVVLLHALWDSVNFIFGLVVIGLISLIWLFVRVRSAQQETSKHPTL
jgi:RsiW-degrading membrane proteinase PrsW (M82 family)